MKRLQKLILYLDDIFILLGIAAIVTASYLVNAIVGTYVLGIAFFIAAIFAGMVLKSPALQKIISEIQKRK